MLTYENHTVICDAMPVYLDSFPGRAAEEVVRPVLRVVLEEYVQCGQVGIARHRLAIESEIVRQLIDKEERGLVAVTADHYRAVLELSSP